MVFEPPLVGLRAERPDQPETARRIREDADHPGAALDLFVEPFEEVRRLQVLVVLPREPVDVQRLPDLRLHPVGQPRIALRPTLEPRLQILLGLLEVAAVVEPAQLLTAIVVGLAGHVVERVPQEVHVAALPDRLGQQLRHSPLQPGVVVGDDELDAVEAAGFEPLDEGRPA